jgi:hypothetical protein
VFAKTRQRLDSIVWTGSRFLYVQKRAAPPAGHPLRRFATMPRLWFRVLSERQITARVPTGATTRPISVKTPAGRSLTSRDFRVVPTVVRVAPLVRPAGTQRVGQRLWVWRPGGSRHLLRHARRGVGRDPVPPGKPQKPPS